VTASSSRARPGRTSAIAALLCAAALAAAAPAGAALVRDAVGRSVAVPEAPRRIVSLAPNITEILYAVGAGDLVVGVTDYCEWPPEAARKPHVGGFVNPSIEAVAALDPDLVLATADGNRPEDVERIAGLGIPVYTVDTRSVAEILRTIDTVGELVGRGKPARALVGELAARREAVRARVAGLPPVPVFVAIDRRPLISAADGTFVGEMIALAGGRNVAGDSPVKYPVVSMERLLAADPAVIVDATDADRPDDAAAAARWRELPGAAALTAVRTGRVHAVGDGSFFIPGPRIMDRLEHLARLLHPPAEGGS